MALLLASWQVPLDQLFIYKSGPQEPKMTRGLDVCVSRKNGLAMGYHNLIERLPCDWTERLRLCQIQRLQGIDLILGL